MAHGNGVPVSGWHILDNAESDEVKAAARELIVKEVQAIRTIKQARRYIDDHAPDKAAMEHLWSAWTGNKDRLECTSLRQLAAALRDAVPGVQVLVVVAWCAITDLTHYSRSDGDYPRKALCAQAFQELSEAQNWQGIVALAVELKQYEALRAVEVNLDDPEWRKLRKSEQLVNQMVADLRLDVSYCRSIHDVVRVIRESAGQRDTLKALQGGMR